MLTVCKSRSKVPDDKKKKELLFICCWDVLCILLLLREIPLRPFGTVAKIYAPSHITIILIYK